MYIKYTLGAIFIVFILCVHCDNADTIIEIKDNYVPSAPQALSANSVTADEIHLSWAPPTDLVRQDPTGARAVETITGAEEPQADEPNETYEESKDVSMYRHEDPYILTNESYRSKRDRRSHRHRKRRQDSATEETHRNGEEFESYEFPNAMGNTMVVKKADHAVPLKLDTTQVGYVLYFEEGVYMKKTSDRILPPTSSDIRATTAFRSDLGVQDSMTATKNLTLLNTSRVLTKVVSFRLKNLTPFTPYKIWVRAFFNTSMHGVRSSDLLGRLGPPSDPLYVLTDVRPPSPPIILNLTCETDPEGVLYIQWRQPLEYNNSLDSYVVTLRKIPELQPNFRLALATNKNEIETTISQTVDLRNLTRYEVKVLAATKSVVYNNTLVDGRESRPEEVSSEQCTVRSAAMSPADTRAARADSLWLALVAAALLTALAAVGAALLYWRWCRSRLSKCISAAYNYLEEGGERAPCGPHDKKGVLIVRRNSVTRRCGDAAESRAPSGEAAPTRPPRMAGPHQPLVRARDFPAHVAALHADGDIGFSKEYEIVVAKSAALAHTSHHSYRPENRLKNRYLNITAYDHSRVCVSAGGRCGAAGCAGRGAGGACDYVNANFIDGIRPALPSPAARRLEQRLERRERRAKRHAERQPSVKAAKPPPHLTEGIESAFLNIEFSGIVESDDQPPEDSDSDRSDDDSELDDVYVDINGVPRQIKLEWAVWRRRYIATQGPTPATLDAFWRMIWQHRVHTLVMITNLVERGRRKCDMYWPAGGRGSSAQFGGVHVTLLYEDVRAAYTVRHLRATHVSDTNSDSSSGDDAGRHITQYHYTVWPDHGTPRHPLAVLPFVRAAADPGTVLVHCSAGVGRTGTYIVIDAQLNQLKLTGTLSPLGFLCRARTQRNHLVQTEEQYVFVHDALLEYVRSGNTEVEFAKAREYLSKLLEPISEEELAVMDLNVNKSELTNGVEDMSSLKSTLSEREIENGSQASIKTDELNDEPKTVEPEPEKDVLVNGDESEVVYDLAPRTTDTYNKRMQAYNKMNEQEKEELRRANRAENYALLERMRSLSNRHTVYQGPPPVNLLEKQFQLIRRSCAEASVCARAPHNAEKNRPGGLLPSDSARVMLVPKPGVEGSEYINASWVCGRRRVREYAVAQHPGEAPELWRLLWDHTAQLVLLLADPNDPECDVFWPTEDAKELFVANFRASFVSKDVYVAYRRSEVKPSTESPVEPETNGYRRQEGSECADDERLIPENSSPINDTNGGYRFNRTELRLENLSNRDLSARKSIANGDLFSSFSEKKNGPKSPRSPSKMSLKNFKLSSPTKFKFPEWGSRTAGSPPDTAPPPPPIEPSLTAEQEAELHRPCYVFEKVSTVPDVPLDRIIEVTNVSVHSLQDDYQLSVKFIKCSGWLDGETADYSTGNPDDNEFVRAVRQATSDSERDEALDRLIEPYKDSFALIEYVAGCQMEYKNGPVVVVDKYGGSRALSFCALSAAGGGARNPLVREPGAEWAAAARGADVYCAAALAAHARCAASVPAQAPAPAHAAPHTHAALLAAYCALAAYGPMLHALTAS